MGGSLKCSGASRLPKARLFSNAVFSSSSRTMGAFLGTESRGRESIGAESRGVDSVGAKSMEADCVSGAEGAGTESRGTESSAFIESSGGGVDWGVDGVKCDCGAEGKSLAAGASCVGVVSVSVGACESRLGESWSGGIDCALLDSKSWGCESVGVWFGAVCVVSGAWGAISWISRLEMSSATLAGLGVGGCGLCALCALCGGVDSVLCGCESCGCECGAGRCGARGSKGVGALGRAESCGVASLALGALVKFA